MIMVLSAVHHLWQDFDINFYERNLILGRSYYLFNKVSIFAIQQLGKASQLKTGYKNDVNEVCPIVMLGVGGLFFLSHQGCTSDRRKGDSTEIPLRVNCHFYLHSNPYKPKHQKPTFSFKNPYLSTEMLLSCARAHYYGRSGVKLRE